MLDCRPMVTMATLAWAAGFLEGEGTFRFNSHTAKRPHSGSPTITAAQKDPESLYRLQAIFGGNTPTKYIARVNRKECEVYQWRIYGERAVGVMQTLYHWLSAYRRAQVQEAISIWRQAPGMNKPKLFCKRGHDFAIHRRPNSRCAMCQRERDARPAS